MFDANSPVIEEFRANSGRVGGWFRAARLLLLTTTGAHRAGAFTYEADAVELVGAEREAAFARAVESDSGWAAYEERSGRRLPVFALVSVPGPPAGGSFAEVLRGVHDAFRRELELIRVEAVTGGATIGAQLRVNCLTLCAGLGNHHAGEDQMLFGFLADRYPEAESLIAKLRVDHGRIAELVAGLRTAVDGEPADLVAEVDRLTDELLRHLDDEETWLLPLLE